MRQSFGFDVFGELGGVGVEGVDMCVKLIKRTENTNKEVGMGGARVAHEFDSGDNRGRGSRSCVDEVHGWGNGVFSERWCGGGSGRVEESGEKGSVSGRGAGGSRKEAIGQ